MVYRRKRVVKRVKRSYKKGRKLNKREIREVKRLIGNKIETKYYSIGASATSVTSAPAVYLLSAIPQGGADGNRVADKVNIKTVDFRYQIIGGDYYNTFRVIIFRWLADSGTAGPTTADLYDTTASGAEYVMCPTPALEKTSKIHIIWDKVFTLIQPNTFTSSGATTSSVIQSNTSVKTGRIKFYGKRLGRKQITFNPTLTTGFGHVYIAVVSDSGGLTHPTIYYNVRVEYTDA